MAVRLGKDKSSSLDGTPIHQQMTWNEMKKQFMMLMTVSALFRTCMRELGRMQLKKCKQVYNRMRDQIYKQKRHYKNYNFSSAPLPKYEFQIHIMDIMSFMKWAPVWAGVHSQF